MFSHTARCCRDGHTPNEPHLILPDPLPVPPKKVKPSTPAPETPPTSLKRSAPDDDGIEEITPPAAKRARTDVLASPSKKRRLEEDGLLLLESKDDKIEDEVIMVD